MVYRKRYKSNRRTTKKVPTNVKRYVRSTIKRNVELKTRQYTYDSVGKDITGASVVSFASISYGSSGAVAALCAGIANGTGEGQRIGGSIKLKGIQVNFAMTPGDNTNFVRMLIVRPKGNWTVSTQAGFLQQLLGNTASSGTQYLAPVDKQNFHCYFDKRLFFRYAPVDGNSATSIALSKFVNKFVRINREISWDIANATVPLEEVFLVAISDSAAVANPGSVAGYVKLWYTDA